MEKDNNWLVEEFDFNKDDPKDLMSQFANESGDVDPAKPAYFNWMCLKNPVGKAVILIARDEASGQIIGQNWFIPMRMSVRGEIYISTMWVNVFVQKDYRRKGVISSIVGKYGDDFNEQTIDFITGIPNANAINVAKVLKMKQVGIQELLVCPLDWSFLMGQTRMENYPILQKPATLLANTIWSIIFPSKRNKDIDPKLRIERILKFNDSFDKFWLRKKNEHHIIFVRDSSFLNWRYTDHPTRAYKIFAVFQENEVVGYLIYRGTKFHGVQAGFIVDFLVEHSTRGEQAGELLIRKGISLAQDNQNGAILSMIPSQSYEGKLLRRNRFIKLPHRMQPLRLLLLRIDRTDNLPLSVLDNKENWFLQLGDFDFI